MTTVNRYRVFNLDTGLEEFGWSETTPTVPFSDSSQHIDPSTVRIIDTIQRTTVALKEDFKTSGGNYQTQGYTLAALASATSTITYSMPFPTVTRDITFASDSTMTGDILDIYTADVVMGTLGAAASIGDTTLVVPPILIAYLFKGFYVSVVEGATSELLLLVLDIDAGTNTITVDRALASAFTTAAFVSFRAYYAKNYVIGLPMKHRLGSNISGGASVPANTTFVAAYQNSTATPKTIYFNVQRLY